MKPQVNFYGNWREGPKLLNLISRETKEVILQHSLQILILFIHYNLGFIFKDVYYLLNYEYKKN
jgi:hypothetical protein